MYEATGKIKIIFDTQTFPSGFTKREFVITTANSNYPQDIKFELIKEKCSWLDTYQQGEEITVTFDIRGNEYNDRYFVNLNCWKILKTGASQPQNTQSNTPPVEISNSETEPSANDLRGDDIPF